MKAIILNEHGSSDVLQFTENFDIPKCDENSVLINIKNTSVNRIDTVIRKGYPQLKLNFPHIIGGDIAGTVADFGSNVKDLKIGERVVSYPILLPQIREEMFGVDTYLNDGWQFIGMMTNGSYTEYISVPAENVVKIPDTLSFEDAASLPIAGITAHHAIHKIGQIAEGDTFFLWGGASGLGTFAIQLAKRAGAKVIATVGKNSKKDILLDLGADYVFNHYEDDVLAEVKKIYPKGIDTVLDFVGPATFDKSFAIVRKAGKIMFCGMMTGIEVKLNIQQTYFRHLSLLGLYLGSISEFKDLIKLAADGSIKPHIDKIFDLKDASKAHNLLESGDYIGKIVLSI